MRVANGPQSAQQFCQPVEEPSSAVSGWSRDPSGATRINSRFWKIGTLARVGVGVSPGWLHTWFSEDGDGQCCREHWCAWTNGISQPDGSVCTSPLNVKKKSTQKPSKQNKNKRKPQQQQKTHATKVFFYHFNKMSNSHLTCSHSHYLSLQPCSPCSQVTWHRHTNHIPCTTASRCTATSSGKNTGEKSGLVGTSCFKIMTSHNMSTLP